METLPKMELAVPVRNEVSHAPKADLVVSQEVEISHSWAATFSVAAGGLGALMGFAFGGHSFDFLPLMAALGLGGSGFTHTLMRYLDADSDAGLKGMKFRQSAVSLSPKEKRIPLVSFGVYDPENTCMKYWVNSNRACENNRATHVVTHYLVKKGFKIYREQEVVQSLESLWDSSLDAVEEHYSTRRYYM